MLIVIICLIGRLTGHIRATLTYYCLASSRGSAPALQQLSPTVTTVKQRWGSGVIFSNNAQLMRPYWL